jgi:hypothetical protein
MAIIASYAVAGNSSLESGDRLGAFTVTKVAGAEGDDVKVGDSLCYRCKYQSRPMVLVFSRTDSESLGKFVQELDASLAKNEDKQLRGLVSMLGDDAEGIKASATKFAKTYNVKNLPVAVPSDYKTGPRSYKIDGKADVVVVVANEGEVIKSFSFAADKVDGAEVMASISTMLKG